MPNAQKNPGSARNAAGEKSENTHDCTITPARSTTAAAAVAIAAAASGAVKPHPDCHEACHGNLGASGNSPATIAMPNMPAVAAPTPPPTHRRYKFREIIALHRAGQSTGHSTHQATLPQGQDILKVLSGPKAACSLVVPELVELRGIAFSMLFAQFVFWHSRGEGRLVPGEGPFGPEARLGRLRVRGAGLGQTNARLAAEIGLTEMQVKRVLEQMRAADWIARTETSGGRRLLITDRIATWWNDSFSDHRPRTVRVLARCLAMLRRLKQGRYEAEVACRNALVLSQLSWWAGRASMTLPDDPETVMVARTIEQLAADTGLSWQAARCAVADLNSLGLVESRCRLYGNNPSLFHAMDYQAIYEAWQATPSNSRTERGQ